MAEPFISEIRIFAGNFAPRGWALCDGQLLAVSGNDALFSLLGTIYGGDGRTTFGLPDLRGRAPMHWGSGPGLSSRRIGQKAGQETVTLTTNQIAPHSHTGHVNAEAAAADASNPVGNQLGGGVFYAAPAASTNLKLDSRSVVIDQGGGGNLGHQNMQPFLCVNFIIATVGNYPSRN